MLSGLGNLLRKRKAMQAGQSQRLQQDSSRLRAGTGDQAQAMQKAQGSAYGRAMNTQPQGPATNSLSRGATDNPQPPGRGSQIPTSVSVRDANRMSRESRSLSGGATDQQRLRQGAEMQKQGMAQSLSRMNTQPGSAPLLKKPLRKKPGALSQGAVAGGMNR